MFSRFSTALLTAAAGVLGAVVAAAGLGLARADVAQPAAGNTRFICRGVHFDRQCVYIQVAYGTQWGIILDSDHNGANVDIVNGTGLRVSSVSGGAVVAESKSYDKPVIAATAYNSATNLFKASNAKTHKRCLIDPNANLTCSGNLNGGAVLTHHFNSSGQPVLAYGAESATATIEDVGTVRMFGGVANVRIDPAFASVIDGKWYYVFLTPLGETRGLFVSRKTPTGFQVREIERGRSSLAFDYRIVAHPLDAADEKLPSAPNKD